MGLPSPRRESGPKFTPRDKSLWRVTTHPVSSRLFLRSLSLPVPPHYRPLRVGPSVLRHSGRSTSGYCRGPKERIQDPLEYLSSGDRPLPPPVCPPLCVLPLRDVSVVEKLTGVHPSSPTNLPFRPGPRAHKTLERGLLSSLKGQISDPLVIAAPPTSTSSLRIVCRPNGRPGGGWGGVEVLSRVGGGAVFPMTLLQRVSEGS